MRKSCCIFSLSYNSFTNWNNLFNSRMCKSYIVRTAIFYYVVHLHLYLVPTIGFELMTYRLQGDCTTTVLIRLIFGCPGWARTNDTRINSPLIYRLIYWALILATLTGFEPVVSAVTGQRIRPTMLKCHNKFGNSQGFGLIYVSATSSLLPYRNTLGLHRR